MNKLATRCDEILFSSDMHIRQRLHELKDRGFGLAKECSHSGMRWSEMVDDGS
jgi:hypothetical protein